MAPMQFSSRVNADVARTFDAFSDLRNADQRVRGIKKLEVLTDGPIGVGTRFKETRIMFGREATETMEISAFERGRHYTVSCHSCGVAWSSTFRFTPEGGGTRVDLEMVCRPLTFFARLMSPLGSLMAGSMKKCVQADMEDLRNYLEMGAGKA